MLEGLFLASRSKESAELIAAQNVLPERHGPRKLPLAAAAVFIREGLKVRDQELQELNEALSDVEDAKARLREKARQVLGTENDDAD